MSLSVLDHMIHKYFKSSQQELCERYCSAYPSKTVLELRKERIWEALRGMEYKVEIWNLGKYDGRHVLHNGDDVSHANGVSISDAYSQLLRNIMRKEGCRYVRDLQHKIWSWEDAKKKVIMA